MGGDPQFWKPGSKTNPRRACDREAFAEFTWWIFQRIGRQLLKSGVPGNFCKAAWDSRTYYRHPQEPPQKKQKNKNKSNSVGGLEVALMPALSVLFNTRRGAAQTVIIWQSDSLRRSQNSLAGLPPTATALDYTREPRGSAAGRTEARGLKCLRRNRMKALILNAPSPFRVFDSWRQHGPSGVIQPRRESSPPSLARSGPPSPPSKKPSDPERESRPQTKSRQLQERRRASTQRRQHPRAEAGAHPSPDGPPFLASDRGTGSRRTPLCSSTGGQRERPLCQLRRPRPVRGRGTWL